MNRMLFGIMFALPLSASAETVKPGAPPAYKLTVKYETPEAKVALACPAGTKQMQLEGAVLCVKVPVPKGDIPIKHGPAVRYASGKMSEQGSYADGKREGVWVAWTDTGAIKSIVTYHAGEYDGPYVTYWANGTVQSEIAWKAGKHHGLSKTWGDDGKPLSVITYDMEKVVGRTDYGTDGKPIQHR